MVVVYKRRILIGNSSRSRCRGDIGGSWIERLETRLMSLICFDSHVIAIDIDTTKSIVFVLIVV
jgi:hypothetical protein